MNDKMTIRDQFAAAALNAIVASRNSKERYEADSPDPRERYAYFLNVAYHAYGYASAMLAEKKRQDEADAKEGSC